MTNEDFLSLTPKQVEAKTGEKMSLVQKMGLKIAQKRFKKELKKNPDARAEGNLDVVGLLSLIFGGLGLILLFTPLGLLGLLLGIAGFVMGFVGMKKDGANKVFRILGIVFGGLTILLLLIGIIFIAAFLL